jgi:hypothetical protein
MPGTSKKIEAIHLLQIRTDSKRCICATFFTIFAPTKTAASAFTTQEKSAPVYPLLSNKNYKVHYHKEPRNENHNTNFRPSL